MAILPTELVSASLDECLVWLYLIVHDSTHLMIICLFLLCVVSIVGRDLIVQNRIVSNLVGIAMSTVMSLIPPGNYGGSPGRARKIVNFHWNSIQYVIDTLLSCELDESGNPFDERCTEIADNLTKSYNRILTKSSKLRGLALGYEKDASKLHKFPRFKVDPNLKVELEKISCDIHVAAFVPLMAAKLLSHEDGRKALLSLNGGVRTELSLLLKEFELGLAGGDIASLTVQLPPQNSGLDNTTKIDVELFLRTIFWMVTEMHRHSAALDKISWGI